MTDPSSGRAALELAGRLVRAASVQEAARGLVGWLQASDPDHDWWVLAVSDPTTAEVLAGHGEGAQVGVDEDGRVAVDDLAGTATDASAVFPIASDRGTWGHLVTMGGERALAEAGVAALEAVVATRVEREELADAVDRLEEAQAVAHMGSYDWDIATDVNRWSDELFRIYGHEPHAFNASYERFQSMIHPDDREMVRRVHEQAYATGEPYHTIERIVRPDGEVRVLDTTGRVIRDPAGQPKRMAGVCIDITERWKDQQAAERSAERFRLLVDTAPEALLVVDPAGVVLQVNERATALFGGEADALVDQHVTALLPDGLPVLDTETSPAADVRDRTAQRLDGSSFPADVTVGATATGLAVAFVRDATDRIREEDERQRDQATALRRVQALEINDNVLQGLAAAIYTLEQGDADAALEVTRSTLGAARALVADLLSGPVDEDVVPGSLVRADPAPRVRDAAVSPLADAVGTVAAAGDDGPVRVVIVDDAEDLRLIFSLTLDATGDFQVVGTAADGREALEVCGRERPDLVLLDLSMPVMDGLQALPLLREALPDTVVVVLSGFDHGHVRDQVLDLGAAAYVEKGTPQSALVDRLRELVAPGAAARA